MVRRWIEGEGNIAFTDYIADACALLAIAIVLCVGYLALELLLNAPV